MMTGKPDAAPGSDHAAGFKSRRAARVDLHDVQASLSPQELYKVEIRVRNVSTAGFMAECAAPVRIGSYVSLDIPGIGPVQAQVRWQIGLRMGGMFLDPISLKSCDWTAEKAAPAEAV
jgi:hypothetical protein